MPQRTITVGYAAKAYESITVSSAAIGITASLITKPVFGVFLTLEIADIRWRTDGGNPTADEGHRLYAGQSLMLANENAVTNLRMFAVAADATVKVSVY